MAKPFSHPQVKTLEVGESASVYDTDADVLVRRVDGYAKRAKRAHDYSFNAARRDDGAIGHVVTRLPDPGALPDPEPQP